MTALVYFIMKVYSFCYNVIINLFQMGMMI